MSWQWWLDTADALFGWLLNWLLGDVALQSEAIRVDEARTAPILAKLTKTAADAGADAARHEQAARALENAPRAITATDAELAELAAGIAEDGR